MARILVNGEWYEEVSGGYEADFEGIVMEQAPLLFGQYRFVPFKRTVESDVGSAKADFALIERSYRGWWIGEIEMANHPFEGHVVPQVQCLSRGEYNDSHVDDLCRNCSDLERLRMAEMIKGKQPRVVVVVNGPVPGWPERLKNYDALVAICQMFRSKMNRYILRVNGESPIEDQAIVSTCEISPLLARFLEIHAPTQLPVKHRGKIGLWFNGQFAEWERVDIQNKVYLNSLRPHLLVAGRPYEIVLQGSDTFIIRERRRGR